MLEAKEDALLEDLEVGLRAPQPVDFLQQKTSHLVHRLYLHVCVCVCVRACVWAWVWARVCVARGQGTP